MTYVLGAALILTIAGFLVLLDRRDRRDREERATLHQRFQAPHAAIHEHHATVTPPAALDPVGMPMSDEEIAQMQGGQVPDAEVEKQRLIAWMEAVENGEAQIEDGVLS